MTNALASPPTSPSGRPCRTEGVTPVVAVALAAYLAFALLRLAAHGWDPSAFVAAGDRFTDATVAGELTVAEDSLGYDGQFFHRLARSPLSTERVNHGTLLDRPAYRHARITYPAMAWVASAGGQPAAVPWALIGVNLVAVAALTAGLADLARRAGRTPWLALLGAGWSGFIVATARDLSEVMAAALLVGAVWAVRERRWPLATALLVGAGLSRETTLVLALGVVGAWSLAHVPARFRPPSLSGRSVPLAVGLVPLAVVGAWRAALAAVWAGEADAGPEIPSFVGPPVVPLARQLGRFAASGDPVDTLQLLLVLGVVATLAVLGRGLLDPDAGRPHERLALIGTLAVIVMLPVWDRAVVFLRWPGDAVVLGLIVALEARSTSWRPLVVIVTGMGVITALMWTTI